MRLSGERTGRSPVEKTLERAQKQAHKTEMEGRREDETPERVLATARSPSAERSAGVAGTTLPVVEEVGEAASTRDRSAHSGCSQTRAADAEEGRWGGNSKPLQNGDSGFESGTTESPIERKLTDNSTSPRYLPDSLTLKPTFSESPSSIDPEKTMNGRRTPELLQYGRPNQ